MKEKIRHFGLDFIKIKKKNVPQDTVKKKKREAKERETIFEKQISDHQCYSKYASNS